MIVIGIVFLGAALLMVFLQIEELRMQGAAKDLQIRMKKIEEQLRLLQRLTSVDVDLDALVAQEGGEEPESPAGGAKAPEGSDG